MLRRKLMMLATLVLGPWSINVGYAQQSGASSSAPPDARAAVVGNGRPVFEMRRQGLSSPFCTSLLQDPRGYVWIGTTNGITRFDGVGCQQFAVDNEAPTTDRAVKALCYDEGSNMLWAALLRQPTLIGIDQASYAVSETPLDKPASAGDILAIAPLDDSTLVARAARAFLTIDKRTGHCSTLLSLSAAPATSAQFLTVNDKLLCCANGLYHIERDADQRPVVLRKPEYNVRALQLARLSGDTAIVYMAQGVEGPANFYSYDLRSKTRRLLATINAIVRDFALAPNGLWLVTNEGLVFLLYSDQRQFTFPARNNSIIDSSPNCIISLDPQPIYLIGSDEGLIMLNYYANKFLLSDVRNNATSSSTQVSELLCDHLGGLWLSDDVGIMLHGRVSSDFERVPRTTLRALGDTTQVVGLAEDADSSGVLVATRRTVLRMDHAAGNRRVLYRAAQDSIVNMQVCPTHGAVVTLSHSVLLLDPQTGAPRQQFDMPAATCRYAHSDDSHTLFVADTSRTVMRLDIATGRWQRACQLDPYEGQVAMMRHTLQDGVEDLWILTTRGALFYNNPPGAELKRITKSPYLNYCARGIELDKAGNLWAATDLGIVRLAYAHANEFPVEDFHLCRQFTTGAATRGCNGQIFFGGVDNFVSFKPDSLSTNHYFPPPTLVAYTALIPSEAGRINEREVLYGGHPIVMPAAQRTIRLIVRILNYDRPDDNLFEWQLDGGEWHRRSVQRDLILDNLSSGPHTVTLRSVGLNGAVQEGVTRVEIVNEVYFYQTWWFRTLVALAAIALAAVIVYLVYTHERRIQKRLEQEVRKQSVKLLGANQELLNRQALIETQNQQLEEANATLEQKVAERTAALEQERQKAVESSEFKSAFLASLGHEIRTPMNAIVGFARLLEMDTCSPNDRQTFAHLILESSNSLLYIIGGLLDTSRIEKGVFDVSFNDLDVSREINDVWQILSVEKKSTGVDFMLEVDPLLVGVHICSDKDRLRQAIINLTYNAFKFTQHGHVALKALRCTVPELRRHHFPDTVELPKLSCDVLLLCVEDTGIGIAESKQEEIFQPFHRLTNNTMKYAGLGLGLNIVKNIARLLGGRVWLYSVVDEGSTFYIYLPLSTERPVVEAEEDKKWVN